MTSLSQTDRQNLQSDLRYLKGALFVGVLVGAGSMILHFSNGSSMLLQCAFETYDDSLSETGHGESAETSTILFRFLNEPVLDARVDGVGRITLKFDSRRGVRVIPDHSGFESYVLRTAKGIFPVT